MQTLEASATSCKWHLTLNHFCASSLSPPPSSLAPGSPRSASQLLPWDEVTLTGLKTQRALTLHGAWRCRHLKVSGGANIEQCFILAAFNFWPFFGKCHWKEPKFIFMHIFNYWKFLWHVFRFFWKFLWKLFNYWEIIAVKMECWTSLIFIYLKYSSLFKKCFWKLFLDNKINLMFPVKLNKVLLL